MDKISINNYLTNVIILHKIDIYIYFSAFDFIRVILFLDPTETYLLFSQGKSTYLPWNVKQTYKQNYYIDILYNNILKITSFFRE